MKDPVLVLVEIIWIADFICLVYDGIGNFIVVNHPIRWKKGKQSKLFMRIIGWNGKYG